MKKNENENFLKVLGMNLKSKRRMAHISTKELADAIGVSEHTINSIERGTRGTSLANYSKLAYMLNTTIDELICTDRRDYVDISSPSTPSGNHKRSLDILCKLLDESQAEIVEKFILNLIDYTAEIKKEQPKNNKLFDDD